MGVQASLKDMNPQRTLPRVESAKILHSDTQDPEWSEHVGFRTLKIWGLEL